MLKFYRILSTIASPFIAIYIKLRQTLGKEDKSRQIERFGKSKINRPEGSLVWIHAASIGESMSVLPLIKWIIEEYPKIHILMTTGTVTSHEILRKRLDAKVIHQYVPVDKPSAAKNFLKHWQPNLSLWVESELWPNLITETHNSGCPMIQINARMSERSFKRWQNYRGMISKLLGCFALSLAQGQDHASRLQQLGAKHTKNAGNLKYDAPALPADPGKTGELVNSIGERHLWLAASTHEGEEEQIANVHIKVKEHHEDLLTIIVPRDPNRGENIAKIMEDKGLKSQQRSLKKSFDENIDIYIADTIGELGMFYRLANIVFIGGSLVDHGGQNPLEPARLECAIISGVETHNFSNIYKELMDEKLITIVKNEIELADAVDQLTTDYENTKELGKKLLHFIESKRGVLEDYKVELAPYLNPLVKS